MAKRRRTPPPGPYFYDVWAGAMRAQGLSLSDWAAAQGIAPSNLKSAATGSTNGPKSKALRDAMIEAVGEDLFHTLYEMRLKNEAAL
jgi:hypothetical protein